MRLGQQAVHFGNAWLLTIAICLEVAWLFTLLIMVAHEKACPIRVRVIVVSTKVLGNSFSWLLLINPSALGSQLLLLIPRKMSLCMFIPNRDYTEHFLLHIVLFRAWNEYISTNSDEYIHCIYTAYILSLKKMP